MFIWCGLLLLANEINELLFQFPVLLSQRLKLFQLSQLCFSCYLSSSWQLISQTTDSHLTWSRLVRFPFQFQFQSRTFTSERFYLRQQFILSSDRRSRCRRMSHAAPPHDLKHQQTELEDLFLLDQFKLIWYVEVPQLRERCRQSALLQNRPKPNLT